MVHHRIVLLLLTITAVVNPSVLLIDAFHPSVTYASATHLTSRMSVEDSEWYSPPPPPKVVVPANSKPLQTRLSTHDDMTSFLHNIRDDRLVVIKYYASWCRTCAKLTRKLDLLASQHADCLSSTTGRVVKHGNVRFGTVEYMDGRELCGDIHKLPTIRMFLPGPDGYYHKVQEFACPPSQFQRLSDLITGYVAQQQKLRQEEDELSEALTRGHAMIQKSLEAADLATRPSTLAGNFPASIAAPSPSS